MLDEDMGTFLYKISSQVAGLSTKQREKNNRREVDRSSIFPSTSLLERGALLKSN